LCWYEYKKYEYKDEYENECNVGEEKKALLPKNKLEEEGG
jgi:hypothetical protein